jgi:UDP-N-acetylmuramyl pentapeptide phosphotransferase/UDP-N-acetylglucosamine-1-phosphate transferase
MKGYKKWLNGIDPLNPLLNNEIFIILKLEMVVYFVVFLSSLFLTSFVRYLAIRKSIIDIPNDRSSHTNPTPRGGGISIAIIWFVSIFFLFLNNNIHSSLFFALLCGLPISVIGLLDDIFTINPLIRFLVQIVSSFLAIICLGGLNSISFGLTTITIPILPGIIAVLGIVWFTNLFNFLDGIDGYISAEVIFICISAYILFGTTILLLLAAVVLGFLVWNWQPAKIFMGDVGSTLLGFSIAVFAIYHQKTDSSSIPIWLIITSVFWFDATLTLFRRWKNHEHLSKAHKKHAYQRIVQAGFSHQKTVLWAFFLNMIGFALAFLAFKFIAFEWLFLLADIFILAMVLKYIDKKNPFPYNSLTS